MISPANPSPTASARPAPAPAQTLRAVIELPNGADLRDLWARPAGPARITEAVQRMRDASANSLTQQWPRFERRLPAGVSARIVEQLWINNSLVVDFDMAATAEGSTPPEQGTAREQLQAVIGWQNLLALVAAPAELPKMPPTAPGRPNPPPRPWNLERLGAPAAWAAGHRGAGVTVGVIDSGTRVDHPEIAAAYRGRLADGSLDHTGSYYDPRLATPTPGQPVPKPGAAPRMTIGHGSAITALAVGAHVGVAPDARFIASVQWGTTPGLSPAQQEQADRIDTLRSIQWMTAPVGADGTPNPAAAPQIVNDSWHEANGAAQATDRYLDTALRNVAAAGIVHVVAAGNTGGAGWLSYPADLDAVIGVGGVDEHDKPVPGLGNGPSRATDLTKPDVAAPETNLTSIRAGGGYQTDQHGGTSSTTPQISGVLAIVDGALLAHKKAPVDVREARFVLEQLARDVHTPGPDNATGFGVPDLRRLDTALAALEQRRSGN